MPDAATIARLASLPGVDTASEVASAPEHTELNNRVLPVPPELAELLPWGGLRRGNTVSVLGSSSLLLALLAEATATGSWAAVVGMPDLGLLAARELGVAVHRVAIVPDPGAEFASVTSALLDGMDLVAVSPPDGVSDHVRRKLSTKARHRGSVLLCANEWSGADVRLYRVAERWSGPQDGYGYLAEREVEVRSTGRGAAARPARVCVGLPGPAGTGSPATAGRSREWRGA